MPFCFSLGYESYIVNIKNVISGEPKSVLMRNVSSITLKTLNEKHSCVQVLRERDTLPCERRPPVLLRIASDLPTQDKQDVADVIVEVCVFDRQSGDVTVLS